MELGDVVLIRDEHLPRQKWRLGKVEELIVGTDRNIRGAKLKVVSKTGESTTCHRPVQKLVQQIPISTTKGSQFQVRDLSRKAAKEGEILRKLRVKYC